MDTLRSLLAALRRPLTSPAMDRRVLVIAICAAVAVQGVVWRSEIASAWWQAKLLARQHLTPLTWPDRPFTPGTWAATLPEARYVYAKDLVRRLKGLSRSEVATLLAVRPESDGHVVPIRRTSQTNLWYVVFVRFEAERVAEASIRLAWLDP